MPDDDDLADKYVLADERLTAAGLGWYEVSNWARDDAARCRHNLLYWTGGDWWGVGPRRTPTSAGSAGGTSSTRRRTRTASPACPAPRPGFLDGESRRVERVLLELRLRDGLPTGVLDGTERAAVTGLADRGLLVEDDERLVLTREEAARRCRGARPAAVASVDQPDRDRVVVLLAARRLEAMIVQMSQIRPTMGSSTNPITAMMSTPETIA